MKVETVEIGKKIIIVTCSECGRPTKHNTTLYDICYERHTDVLAEFICTVCGMGKTWTMLSEVLERDAA